MLLIAPGAGACRKKDAAPVAAPSAGDAAAATLAGKILRIAMIAKSSSPSFLSARTGAEDRARELSPQVGAPIEIDWLTPSQEDGQVQAQRILQAVNDRVDAILISCSDDPKVSRAIDDAVARGVAVMTFDSDAPGSRRFAFCAVDDFEIGRRLLTELASVLATQESPGATASQLRPRTKGVPAKVASVGILGGDRSAPNLQRRVDGVMAEAAHHPELKIVGTFFHAETAQEASAEVLRANNAHPDLAGWVMVGGWPLYNRTLLSELQGDAGRSLPKIVAVNALPPQLVYVEKGYVSVLLAQPTYLWGAVGVETIVNKLLRKQDVPWRIPMELVRVTERNLGSWARQLKAWGFGDVPDEYMRLE